MEQNGALPKSNPFLPYLILLANFFIWGSIYVAAKYAIGQVSPVVLAGGRYLVALLVLLPVGWRSLKVRIDRADWKYLLVIGGLGYYLQTIVNMQGVGLIEASTASLINSLNPVSISIIAAVMLHERIDKIQIFCIVLSILGTAVVSSAASGGGQLLGIVLCLAASILWGFTSVSLRHMTSKYGAMTVTLYATLVSLVFFLPSMLIDVCINGIGTVTLDAAAAILYMGVFGTAIGGFLWTKALSLLEASFCSMFYPLQTLFSAILGAVLLHETFRSSFFIGAAIITVSIVMNCLHRANQQKQRLEVQP